MSIENVSNESTVPHRQRPLFLIDQFDENVESHMRGMICIRMNARQALDLVNLIRDSELTENEHHLFALQANIQRWYDTRYIAKGKAIQAEIAKTAETKIIEAVEKNNDSLELKKE